MRQLVTREEDAAEEHHGRQKQGEVVGEKVVTIGDGVKNQRDAAEGDAYAEQNRPRDQQLRAMTNA